MIRKLLSIQRQKLGRRGFLNKPGAIAFSEKIVQQFDVRTPSVRNGARSLSGGNLQKFVIGREILQNPRVFVVNQPTWGVVKDWKDELRLMAGNG